MELQEFKKVSAFFHDGLIDNIQQIDKNIYIWTMSAEMLPEWIEKYPIQVSSESCIKGVLHFVNVKELIVNGVSIIEYKQNFVYAEILNFDVYDDHITLIVTWRNWIRDNKLEEFQKIEVYAERVFWKHDDYMSASPNHRFESSYKPQETI